MRQVFHSSLLVLLTTMIGFLSPVEGQVQSLDGQWQFAVDSTRAFSIHDVGQEAIWRTAVVPLSWQAQFPDLRDYQGVAWYRKTINLPALNSAETALLRFDAVDYVAEVFVNGISLGTHEGGYTPFAFDVRGNIKPGENEIVVRVMDPAFGEKGTEGIRYQNIPHGKQSWYVQTSGIWRSVSLTIKPLWHISRVKVTPSLQGGLTVDVALQSVGSGRSRQAVSLRVFDPAGKRVLGLTKSVSRGDTVVRFDGTVRNVRLWSLTEPNLYRVEVTFGIGDTVVSRFGFRKIESREGRLLLNGEPLYMIGALDQDFYPETVYTTPSRKYLRDEMVKAKKIGLNTLRCHIKVPDERYLEVADELGLLVWYEIPNWDQFTTETGRRADETLDAMLERDWNHPSLVIISLINESWGLDLQKGDQRAWLKRAFDRAKEKAIGRLIVDNSACGGNFHIKTDIADYHAYWSIPENHARFDETVADLAKRPSWLFSTFGDAAETRNEPLLLSEFGNWGLPKLPHPFPWWLSRPFGNATVALPKDFDKRFVEFGYDDIFKTYDQLAEESQRAQFEALKYEIEQLRLSREIQGYVITEFTDINWESNGLLDMWRNVKIYEKELAPIQQQDVIIPRPGAYNYRSGESVEVKVWLSHFGSARIDGGWLEWRTSTGLHDMIPIASIARAEVRELTPIRFRLKEEKTPQQVRLYLQVKNGEGIAVANNFCDVYAFPHGKVSGDAAVTVYDPQEKLGTLRSVFAQKASPQQLSTGDKSLVVTNVLNDVVLKHLEQGGRVLCLVDSTTKTPPGAGISFVNKNSSWYDGNWATNFNWIRTNRPPFQSVYFGRHLGFEAAAVAPARVIAGIPPAHFPDVLAGMFVGWIQLNSGYLVQMRVGQGKLLLCTLNLADAVGRDPYATSLFNELETYTRSTACAPVFSLTHE